MKALILENKVVDIAEAVFEVAPTLKWKDCSDEVKAGWTVKGNTFSAPIPRPRLDDDGVTIMPKWKINRKEEYPELPDQLDMIFNDAINGTSIWKDSIATIKEAHPKPE
jgi:hypothetical protein